jgi:hypothetical protein
MYRRVLKSMVLASVAVLVAIPASAPAQVRAEFGPFHIRIAGDPPPRVRFEARTTRPNRTAVWTNGYWDRQGDQWAWSTGRWQQPVAPRARWVKARYQREGCPWYRRQNCSWRYEPAHWSNQQLVEGEDYQAYRKARYSGNRRR